MAKNHTREDVERFHRRLPARIRGFLRQAGLPDHLIDRRLLGWNGESITAPVFDADGELHFVEYLSDPVEGEIPETVEPRTYRPAAIYGWETLLAHPSLLLITDGAFERLILEARRFRTIAVLGDPMSFKEAWVSAFQGIREVYVLFTSSGRGHRMARHVAGLIPQARILELPGSIGWRGTVAEYFLTHGHDRQDLLKELIHARSGLFSSKRPNDGKRKEA